MIGHGQGLGVTLGLVVDTPWAGGAYVAPVFLVLGVHERVAVDLRGGGEHEAGPPGAGKSEAVVSTKCAALEYLYRDAHEVGWARGGGEMVDFVELSGKVYVDTDVVFYILEICFAGQEGGHVLEDARTEVVDADDLIALGEEPLAEVTADEPSPSRNQCPRPSSPCHSHVRSLCIGALLPVRPSHRGHYGRPR